MITPYSLLKVNRRFGGMYRRHLQGWRIIQARNQYETDRKQSSDLFFDPEDGGDFFLRNVGWHSKNYTALYARRQKSSTITEFTK
jgi:hypothetical protein